MENILIKEIFVNLFRYFNIEDLYDLRLVNKRFSVLLNDPFLLSAPSFLDYIVDHKARNLLKDIEECGQIYCRGLTLSELLKYTTEKHLRNSGCCPGIDFSNDHLYIGIKSDEIFIRSYSDVCGIRSSKIILPILPILKSIIKKKIFITHHFTVIEGEMEGNAPRDFY